MTFEDKPEPGLDYLAYLLLTALITLASIVWSAGNRNTSGLEFNLISLSSLGALLFFLLKAFRAAYNTSYSLDGETLTLRRGKTEKKLALDSIKSIGPAGTNLMPLTLGIGSKDFCNRLTDVVRLVATGGKFYVSPSNPQLFISHIRGTSHSLSDSSVTAPGGAAQSADKTDP